MTGTVAIVIGLVLGYLASRVWPAAWPGRLWRAWLELVGSLVEGLDQMLDSWSSALDGGRTRAPTRLRRAKARKSKATAAKPAAGLPARDAYRDPPSRCPTCGAGHVESPCAPIPVPSPPQDLPPHLDPNAWRRNAVPLDLSEPEPGPAPSDFSETTAVCSATDLRREIQMLERARRAERAVGFEPPEDEMRRGMRVLELARRQRRRGRKG